MYKKVIDQISGIFFPIINIITGASILKSVVVLAAQFGWITQESGVYQIFYAVAVLSNFT